MPLLLLFGELWIAIACAGGPKGDCPASIDALPPSLLYVRDDPRLKADGIVVVLKEARRAMVFSGGKLATVDGGPACYAVALAQGYPAGHKQRRGDLRTPEGLYRLSDRPWSSYAHALTVHYPSASDAEWGLQEGLITRQERDEIVAAAKADRAPPMQTKLGGLIALHGGGNSVDWTLGCVAFDDDDLVALRSLLPEDLRADILILP